AVAAWRRAFASLRSNCASSWDSRTEPPRGASSVLMTPSAGAMIASRRFGWRTATTWEVSGWVNRTGPVSLLAVADDVCPQAVRPQRRHTENAKDNPASLMAHLVADRMELIPRTRTCTPDLKPNLAQ